MRALLLLAGLLHLTQTSSLQAGWIIQGKQQNGQDPALTQTTLLDTAGLRVETSDGLVIFQAKEKKLIMANPADKTYQVMDRESMAKMVSGLGAAMKQMQDAMAGMTAEQKAMMEKMMGDQTLPISEAVTATMPAKPPVTTYKKLATGVKVGPWETEHYEVLEDGIKESEIWVAPPSSLAIEKDLLKLFAEMGDFFKELMAAVPLASQAGKNSLELELPGENAPLGIPVKEVVYENGAPASSWEITQATQAAVPPEKLQIPAGYTEVKIPGMGQ